MPSRRSRLSAALERCSGRTPLRSDARRRPRLCRHRSGAIRAAPDVSHARRAAAQLGADGAPGGGGRRHPLPGGDPGVLRRGLRPRRHPMRRGNAASDRRADGRGRRGAAVVAAGRGRVPQPLQPWRAYRWMRLLISLAAASVVGGATGTTSPRGVVTTVAVGSATFTATSGWQSGSVVALAAATSDDECAAARPGWIWCDDFEQDRLSQYFEYDNADGAFVRVRGAGRDGALGIAWRIP